MVLLYALVHALPVVLTGLLFRDPKSLKIAAGIMAVVAVIQGSPQYMLLDLLAVGGAWFMSRAFLDTDRSTPDPPKVERLIDGATVSRRRPALPSSKPINLSLGGRTDHGTLPTTSERVDTDADSLSTTLQRRIDVHSSDAAYKMGLRCESDQFGPPDLSQAAIFYETAASRGHMMAQYRLGLMYNRGEGVIKDDVQAYAWLSLAAIQGLELAGTAISSIQQHMDPAQIAQADAMRKRLGARIYPMDR